MVKISGLEAAQPISPPASCIASVPSSRPGAPQAMWTSPSTPMTSAERPMTIRPLASGFSRIQDQPYGDGAQQYRHEQVEPAEGTGDEHLDQIARPGRADSTRCRRRRSGRGRAAAAPGRPCGGPGRAPSRRALCRGTSPRRRARVRARGRVRAGRRPRGGRCGLGRGLAAFFAGPSWPAPSSRARSSSPRPSWRAPPSSRHRSYGRRAASRCPPCPGNPCRTYVRPWW